MTATEIDSSFRIDVGGLSEALRLLDAPGSATAPLPDTLPEAGIGEAETMRRLAPYVLGMAAALDDRLAFAHMDPPTPWITWAMALWNARLNQNLLHPGTAPFARDAERQVVAWLAPAFGMRGGHMTAGSTLANLTALWAARDAAGVRRVVASSAAHVSVAKAAAILGLRYEVVPVDQQQRLSTGLCPDDLSDACLVLTAGTTGVGAIDPLDLIGRAAWTHVDAAWAGPLRLSERHRDTLDGIEQADSVAVSAHKWLFQPKGSALVLFREPERVAGALTYGGSYLAAPNIGVLGSQGAVAVPLLATLLAWGRDGFASRIDHSMALAERLADAVEKTAGLELFGAPTTGVVVFRPTNGEAAELAPQVGPSMVSTVVIDGILWLRCVAANPMANVDGIVDRLGAAARRR